MQQAEPNQPPRWHRDYPIPPAPDSADYDTTSRRGWDKYLADLAGVPVHVVVRMCRFVKEHAPPRLGRVRSGRMTLESAVSLTSAEVARARTIAAIKVRRVVTLIISIIAIT